MSVEPVEDEVFGQLLWNEDSKEWEGLTTISPHGEVGVLLPQEYFESDEMRTQIRERVELLRQNEGNIRQSAVHQLHDEDNYLFWWPDDNPFDFQRFVSEMTLVTITFEIGFRPADEIHLWYEYADGMEHAILLELHWDGSYHSARCA